MWQLLSVWGKIRGYLVLITLKATSGRYVLPLLESDSVVMYVPCSSVSGIEWNWNVLARGCWGLGIAVVCLCEKNLDSVMAGGI